MDRHGFLAGVLDVDLEVILHVFADAGEVRHDLDTEPFQVLAVTDPRQLQQLGRVEGAATGDDFLGHDRLRRGALHAEAESALAVLDADRFVALEEDLVGLGPSLERQIAPLLEHGVQVGTGSRQAPGAVHVLVESSKALLLEAIDVVGPAVAGFLTGLQPGVEQWCRRRAAFHRERAVVTPQFGTLVGVEVGAGAEAGLHALEVREAVLVAPRLHAGDAAPLVVIHRVAPLENHAVDAR